MFLKSIILVTSLSCLLDATNSKIKNILQQVNRKLPAPLRKFIKRHFFEELPKVDGYYNPEIFEELQDNLPNMPTDIVGIMAVYGSNPFDDLKREITKELHPTKEELDGLVIYDLRFNKKFCNIFEKKEERIKRLGYPMLLTLNRMFFKWIIMRRKSLSNKDFEKLIEKYTSNIWIRLSPRNMSASVFNLNPCMSNEYDRRKFKFLIDHELIENPDNVRLKFGSVVEDYYVKGFNCKEIKTKYFNEKFNHDPLLKAMIQIYDPIGLMRNDCLPDRCYSDYPTLEPSPEITLEYLENLKKKGPQPNEISWMNLINHYVDEAVTDDLFKESKAFSSLLSLSFSKYLFGYILSIIFPSNSRSE